MSHTPVGGRLTGMTHGGCSIYKQYQSNLSKTLIDVTWQKVKPSDQTATKFQVLQDLLL